jgi:hypothetical protein
MSYHPLLIRILSKMSVEKTDMNSKIIIILKDMIDEKHKILGGCVPCVPLWVGMLFIDALFAIGGKIINCLCLVRDVGHGRRMCVGVGVQFS